MSSGSSAAGQGELKAVIEGCGAVMHGHFKLASGRHSGTYIEKFRVLERPAVLERVAASIADHYREMRPEMIVGPSTGGIIVAYEIARQLGVTAVYVEADNGKRLLKRNGRIPAGTRVLVVDDVLTTGISLVEVLEVVKAAGGDVVGIGVLIDRTERAVDFGFPLFAASRFEATSYVESEMPAWLAEIPLTVPGTRASLVDATG